MIYEYSTPSFLKEEGVTGLSDSKLRKLIRLYSSRINKIVGHSFIASPFEYDSLPLNGDLYRLPGPKIIEVISASYGYSDLSRTFIEPLNIGFEGNLVNLNTRGLRKPVGVKFSYLAGDMIGRKRVKVKTLERITDSTTQFKVNSVEGLVVRDVLQSQFNCFIITGINYDENIITIDAPYQIAPLPANEILSCYGQVPYEIEEALMLFIKHHDTLQSNAGRMKSERIGDYSYEQFEGKNSLSGIAEIDSILSGFFKDDFNITFL